MSKDTIIDFGNLMGSAAEQSSSSVRKAKEKTADVDGRTMRATGRTRKMTFVLTDDLRLRIVAIAKERQLLLAEVIERGIELLEQEKRK